MIRRLLAPFNLAQVDTGIGSRIGQHGPEQIIAHEMGTRTGSQVPAPGQQFHGFQIDFLITTDGIAHRMARFGEGWRIEDDEIIVMVFMFGQVRQKVKDIGLHCRNLVFQSVAADIFSRHGNGFVRYIDGGNTGRSSSGCIEGKGSRVGETVQYMMACGNFGYGQAVIFLIEEKPVFWPFSTSTSYKMPFSSIVVRALPGSGR